MCEGSVLGVLCWNGLCGCGVMVIVGMFCGLMI